MKAVLAFFLFLIVPFRVESQIEELVSPGSLSRAHSRFSGVKNCRVCHGSDKNILESKCLDCHKELAFRIRENKGFHADKRRNCIACHTEHPKKAKQVRFTE